MKKIRILSSILIIIFVLSSVNLAFAQTSFKYGKGNLPDSDVAVNFLAPIEDYPLRHAYTAHDSENSSKTYKYSYSNTFAGADGVWIDSEGVLNIDHNVNSTVNMRSTNIKAYNSSDSNDKILSHIKYNYVYKSLDVDFQDGDTTGLSNVVVTSDGNGNFYGVKEDGTRYIAIPKDTLNAPSLLTPVVLEFDALVNPDLNVNFSAVFEGGSPSFARIDDTGFFKYQESDGGTFYGCGSDQSNYIVPGWHNFRWIIKWPSTTYDVPDPFYNLYIDNQLVLENAQFPSYVETTSSPSVYLRIYNSKGIDNVKYFSTSLGIPYDMELIKPENLTVGDVVTANAKVFDMPGNLPETTEYVFYKSDTIDGEYTELSFGKNYTIKNDDVDKYIKVGARVSEEGASQHTTPWFFGEPVKIQATVDWVEHPESYVYLPHGNDIYETPYSFQGGYKDGLSRVEQGNDQFELRPIDKPKAALLTFSPDVNGIVSTDLQNPYILSVQSADKSSVIQTKVAKFPVYDFTNGDASIFTSTDGTSLLVETDSNGGKYLTSPSDSKIQYDFFLPSDEKRISDTYAIDFDYLSGEGNSIELDFWQDETATVKTSFPIKIASDIELGYYKDPDSSSPYMNVGEGFKKARIFIDSKEKEYSVFIGDKALAVNLPIKGVTSDVAHPSSLYIKGAIDNFTISNVTIKTPVAYHPTIRNAAVDKPCVAEYDFYCGGTNDKSTTFEWYVSNTKDGEYTLKGNTYTPTQDDYGKYVKALIFPESERFGDMVVGTPVWTEPRIIADIALGTPTLKVKGAIADIKKKCIANDENISLGADVDCEIKIPASINHGSDGKVLVAIAQYNDKILENVSFINKTLSSSSEDIVLNLTATNLKKSTYFKLLMFKENGLTPICDPIYIQ